MVKQKVGKRITFNNKEIIVSGYIYQEKTHIDNRYLKWHNNIKLEKIIDAKTKTRICLNEKEIETIGKEILKEMENR